MVDSRVDRATVAFRLVLAEATDHEQARVDALLALWQRKVFAAVWPGPNEPARTLTNGHGESALPLFTGPDALEIAADRFNWREPDGSLRFRELDAREALQHALTRQVQFVVLDVGLEHSLEFAREELEPLLSQKGPTLPATSEQHAAVLEAVRRNSRPPGSGAAATSIRASAPPPSMVPKTPPPRSPLPARVSPPPTPPRSPRPPGSPPPLPPSAAGRRTPAPSPPPVPAVARRRSSSPGLPRPPSSPDSSASSASSALQGSSRSPSSPARSRSPVPQASPGLPGSVSASPAARPRPAIETRLPPKRRSRDDEPTLAERPNRSQTQRGMAVCVPDAALHALSSELRGFPEVEWACVMADDSEVPLIGVRIDPSFLNRVADITDVILDIGERQSVALQVLLLNNQELLRNARRTGRAFYPGQR